jgi:hypothetical protein
MKTLSMALCVDDNCLDKYCKEFRWMRISSEGIILFLLLGEFYFRYASRKLNRLQLEDYWVKVDYVSVPVISYTMILHINKNIFDELPKPSCFDEPLQVVRGIKMTIC